MGQEELNEQFTEQELLDQAKQVADQITWNFIEDENARGRMFRLIRWMAEKAGWVEPESPEK